MDYEGDVEAFLNALWSGSYHESLSKIEKESK